MPTVIFEPISKHMKIPSGQTIYQAVQKLGHTLTTVCGGNGICGKCKVIIIEGNDNLNSVTETERKFLSDKLIEQGYRLACRSIISGDVRIMIPPESLEKKGRILVDGKRVEIAPNPLSQKVVLMLSNPTIENILSDVERLKSSLSIHNIIIPITLLRDIPAIIRNGKNIVTSVYLNQWKDNLPRLLNLQAGDHSKNHFGFAVDIGTTTVVGYLINLLTGEIVATSSMLNPQVAFGEDIITRIVYTQSDEGLDNLNRAILDCITHLCEDACILGNISIQDIHEITIVGNTVMHHIFLRLPTKYLGLAPFTPVLRHSINLLGADLGLKNLERVRVHLLPVIAGFVGADTIGVILAANLDEIDPLTLTIDVGTNGELILGNKEEGLIAGSCAAGCSMEGAQIQSGMRATGGAIEKVTISPETFDVTYQTINNEPPIGICGSGVIDTVAEMLRTHILTRNGNFNKTEAILNNPRIRKGRNGYEFVIAFENETPSGKSITFSQKDVREVQLAKAAFYAGAKLLMMKNGKTKDDLEQILLAGAFGSYLDKKNVHFIGMIPDISQESIYQIGNAAGIGAQYSLLNQAYREKEDRVARTTRYLELTTQTAFTREYAMAMYFPHQNYEKEFPSLVETFGSIPIR